MFSIFRIPNSNSSVCKQSRSHALDCLHKSVHQHQSHHLHQPPQLCITNLFVQKAQLVTSHYKSRTSYPFTHHIPQPHVSTKSTSPCYAARRFFNKNIGMTQYTPPLFLPLFMTLLLLVSDGINCCFCHCDCFCCCCCCC